MKKNNFVIIGVIALILLILISFTIGNNGEKELSRESQNIVDQATKEVERLKVEDKKDLTTITADEYLEYYNGDTPTLILLSKPTCEYCLLAEPILEYIAYRYDLDIKYINIEGISAEDQYKIAESDERYSEGFGTPNLLVVGGGKTIDVVDGLDVLDQYVEFLKKNNFIEE